MPTDYKSYAIDRAPEWLRKPQGEAWLRAQGDGKDELLQRTIESVKARFPLLAPADALQLLGAERGITRIAGESLASFATRISQAWDSWYWAGTARGVLSALYEAGFGNPHLYVANGVVYHWDSSHTTFSIEYSQDSRLTFSQAPDYTFDPQHHWATFAVVFWTMPSAWGGVAPAQGSATAKLCLSIIDKWKSAHARLSHVYIPGLGRTWGMTSLGVLSPPVWGTGTWGGTGVTWTP